MKSSNGQSSAKDIIIDGTETKAELLSKAAKFLQDVEVGESDSYKFEVVVTPEASEFLEGIFLAAGFKFKKNNNPT